MTVRDHIRLGHKYMNLRHKPLRQFGFCALLTGAVSRIGDY